MTTRLPRLTKAVAEPFTIKPTFCLIVGLLMLVYAPVLKYLASYDWAKPESSYSPIILVLAFWLMFRSWDESLVRASVSLIKLTISVALQLLAASLYAVGTLGEIPQLAYGSLIVVLLALHVRFQHGTSLVNSSFAILFLLFSVPLPGFVVDPITLPMKLLVSSATTALLHSLGFPIASSGVMLYLWPYTLQVADACAGLRTLFTLEALGLLYCNLVASGSRARNITIALLVLPISFIANVTRVTLLCLITFYWGDHAGQGYLHQFAGVTLFLCALLLLVACDTSLRGVFRRQAPRDTR